LPKVCNSSLKPRFLKPRLRLPEKVEAGMGGLMESQEQLALSGLGQSLSPHPRVRQEEMFPGAVTSEYWDRQIEAGTSEKKEGGRGC
jgi:hypothetical protein